MDLNTDGHPVYMMNTKNGLLNQKQIEMICGGRGLENVMISVSFTHLPTMLFHFKENTMLFHFKEKSDQCQSFFEAMCIL